MAAKVDLTFFAPDPLLLLLALVLDLLIGDPVYALHPIRVLGAVLTRIENVLRALGSDGYVGGCLLFVLLACLAVGITSTVGLALAQPIFSPAQTRNLPKWATWK